MYISNKGKNQKGPQVYEPKYGQANFSNYKTSSPLNEGSPKTAYADKARSNLRFGSVQVKADPYTAMLPGSEPYMPTARFNRATGPNYAGKENLDGGSLQQYSYSPTSKYLKAFDYARMAVYVNYNYLPMFPSDAVGAHYPGKLLIDETIKALAEAGSILGATTFTNLAFNQYAIETDLPMGSSTPIEMPISGTSNKVSVYTDFADTFYAFSTMYQLVLQACRMNTAAYNSFRLKMGTMIRSAFNREVPQLNSLFGLLKKSSFLSLIESINMSFEGEYLDTDFMKTIDVINLVPSRRSNSYFDPLLELNARLSHPTKFKIHILNADRSAIIGKSFDLYDYTSAVVDGTKKDIFQIQEYISQALSATDTVEWARSTEYNETFANERFNLIKYHFDAVNTILTRFKIIVADLREAMDVMARSGIVRWTKGFRPLTTKLEDAEVNDNRFVSDVFKSAMCGARDVFFNSRTKRWDTFTLWSLYNGIPEYDMMSGGAFLTFSFKEFVTSDPSDSTIGYIPRVFSGWKDGQYDLVMYLVNREGTRVTISRDTPVKMSENATLSRLAPLGSQSDLYLRVPSVSVNNLDEASLLYRCLTQIFGASKVVYNTSTDYSLDPDIISIYQVELEDVTNEALNYARAHCVVRGSSKDDGIIGFASI